MSEWISVDDRLPNLIVLEGGTNSDPVLVTDGDETCCAYRYVIRNKSSWSPSGVDSYDCCVGFAVTHWMPLPEPPQ